MKIFFLLSFLVFSTTAFGQNNPHQNPTHNFDVHRLIIVNDNNEMLMAREQHVWAAPSYVYKDRQYIKESFDSLAHAYGLQIADLKLHGQFSYKYDYHPHSTLRHYYVARYVNGKVKVPKGMDEAKWMPIPEAIEANTVTSIKEITQQIIQFPKTVWGGSFMVSHVGDEHPTKMVEAFYALF
ncbi:MAG: hypothetical protein AAF806_19170 [Bacteroidota bacterium]